MLNALTDSYSVNFGRVPVRTVFEDALECLKENERNIKGYVTHELKLEDAAQGYELFEQHKARKVILRVHPVEAPRI